MVSRAISIAQQAKMICEWQRKRFLKLCDSAKKLSQFYHNPVIPPKNNAPIKKDEGYK